MDHLPSRMAVDSHLRSETFGAAQTSEAPAPGCLAFVEDFAALEFEIAYDGAKMET